MVVFLWHLGAEYLQEVNKSDIGTKIKSVAERQRYDTGGFGGKAYEGTNIIKMTVADGVIKGFSVPEEFLTFYYEMPEEEMEFFRSLAE